MAITSTTRKSGPYLSDGEQLSYSFDFKVFATSDIKVVSADLNGAETTLILDTDYSATLNEDQENDAGGSITLIEPLTENYTLIITSDIALTQDLALQNSGNFSPTAINNALDKIVIQLQQVGEKASRAVKSPITSEDDPDEIVNTLLQAKTDTEAARDTALEIVGSLESLEQAVNDAEGFSESASTSETNASNSETAALAAKNAAESARDSAFTNANVYANTTDGLAATTDGQQFTVVVGMFLNRYRRDSASVATLVASTPNSTAAMQEYRYGSKSGRLDAISFYSQIVARQTLGGSTSPLTLSATGGLTIAISSAGNSRIFAMSTPYYVENGVFVAELAATVSTIPATRTPSIGFAIGGAGTGCRHYMWRSDGLVTRATDAESFTTILAASSATAFIATDVIKFRIEVNTATAKAVLTCTKNGAVVSTLSQSSVPIGLLELTSRGEGGFIVSNIYTDGVSSEAMTKIEEAATPELTESYKSSLYLSQQFFDAFEIFTPDSWTGVACPIRVFDINGTVLTDYNPTDHYPFELADADSVYYVDVATGSDSNAGTELAPFKSLRYAIHGRTGNVLVYVKAGSYLRADGFNDPNPLCTGLIIKRWGSSGRILSSMAFSGLSWSATAGRTNVYQVTTSATPTAAIDQSNLSSAGDAKRLTLQSSLDNVEANANSLYISGSTVYVRTFDNRAPDADILVFESKRNFLYNVADGVVWAEYIDFEGGDRPAQVSHTLDHSKQAEAHFLDCTFKYAGGTRNGFSTDGEVYSYLKSCIAAQNVADGFNYHKLTSSAAPVAVEIDCIGRGNGWNSATINNGSTMHDGGTVFRINGTYTDSEGRVVHDVGNSHSWNVKCLASNSRAVVASPVANVNWAAGIDTDTTKMYLYKCSGSGSTHARQTIDDAIIYSVGYTDSASDVVGSDIQAYE